MAARVVPLHCIIPPHMLREIAQRGDPDQQAWAFHTLSLSEQLRGQRQALGAFAPATPADAMPIVLEAVHYVCAKKGGEGAVRELADLILAARGKA